MSKIAVFIDGENLSAKKYANSIQEISRFYSHNVQYFVYGKKQHLVRWKEIEHFNCVTVTKGANKADIKMSQDVHAKLYEDEVDTFIIVAKDGHFLQLCQIIKQFGKGVIVMGTDNTAKLLQEEFEFMLLTPPKPPQPKVTKAKQKSSKTQQSLNLKPIKQLQKLLEKVFSTLNVEWIDLPELGKQLRQIDPKFTHKAYGSATLSKLLRRLPEFVEMYDNRVKLKL